MNSDFGWWKYVDKMTEEIDQSRKSWINPYWLKIINIIT